MADPDPDLLLRTPTWARAFVAVFPVIFAGFALLVLRPDGAPVALAAGVAVLLSALLAWRLFRLAVIGTADGALVVRNHWRDRTLSRGDVASVAVERRAGTSNHAVALRLHDGTAVWLEVTETPFAGPFRGRLERQAHRVRGWITGTPRPYR